MLQFKDLKPPFIIAEMSGNHNQSLEQAIKMIEIASECGVDAIKFQTYTPDTITLNVRNKDFQVTSEAGLWEGRYLYDLYNEAHTPWEWHVKMFQRCKELGLLAFSSPFDHSAVDFLETLEIPCYKIASFEIVDLPLIRYVAQKNKPMIISTGMSTLTEIEAAVTTAREAGCKDLVLLKCSSTYPADPANSHLKSIATLRELFNCPVGFSDHTPGIGAALMSFAYGGVMLEKHFTLSRADGAVDSAFSLEPHELKQLVIESKRAVAAIGQVQFGPTEAEKGMQKYRRSLYVTKDIKPGEKLTEENIRSVRPSYGLAPKYYDAILQRVAKTEIKKGTALNWDLVE